MTRNDMTLDNLLSALASQGSDRMAVDEMNHSGGAGTSYVERWLLISPVTTKIIGIEAADGAGGGVWLWRVMWIPRRERGPSWRHQHSPALVAHGISKDGEPGAQTAGRKAATRLAKARRAGVTP